LNTNTSTREGGGIYVNGGFLEMNEGCEISENIISYKIVDVYAGGGGIYVNNNGNVVMRGGTITSNVGVSRGGGIHITGNSTVNMTGGTISKNSCVNSWSISYGGGIYVTNGSSFIKRSIPSGSSSSGIIYGSTGEDANIVSNGGSTIYRDFGTKKQRNSTLGGYDEISTGNDEGWE